ncbi:hypothetical protein SASPL_147283 [Salvia splendens]|uniref:Uncharacterized protein n=1 Tax=Salvia splendens TaxID=180675 RepID=A0A8X8WDR6_SALSN|nr:hypothetical protein SASPL_147283 [Salvia splendens]
MEQCVADRAGIEEEFLDEFQCCVCLDIMYKPVVLGVHCSYLVTIFQLAVTFLAFGVHLKPWTVSCTLIVPSVATRIIIFLEAVDCCIFYSSSYIHCHTKEGQNKLQV